MIALKVHFLQFARQLTKERVKVRAKVGIFSVLLSALLFVPLLSVSLLPTLATAADDFPERAQDLRYGSTLFEYYQGRSFEALTLLNVAKERGGIVGHGEHPKLVEGGLMLSYGMTREAKAHFEAVLVDEMKGRISPSVRNQAWFYLGKVFYLEQDALAATSAFERVDMPLLQESDVALYEELLYLRAQLALLHPAGDIQDGGVQTPEAMTFLEQLPADSLWRAYVRYNLALKNLEQDVSNSQEPASTSEPLNTPDITSIPQQDNRNVELEALAQDLSLAANWRVDDQAERLELLARTRLSLAQHYLQTEAFDLAMRHLKAISLDSVFSDEALFHYAVAASHQGQYGLSLEALNRLKSRTLFTPWLQQVPYALGYLYEQFDDLNLASQAYHSAANHYENLVSDLKQKSDGLTEASIIAALAVRGEPELERELKLGVSTIDNDAYGRIHVRPVDFEIAQLLSSEIFQLGLRDLHELYKLKGSLTVWARQLSSFDVMLQTRDQQRQDKLAVTQTALHEQDAEHWQQQQASYSAAITAATENEDINFFMDEEQLEFKTQIQDVLENLKGLPDGEDKAEYAAKIQRIKAYFDWWIADRYSVNRWAAQKELNALNYAMDEFGGRHQTLSQELASTTFQQGMRDRVVNGQRDLEQLSAQLDEALVFTRQALLDLVREELLRQQAEVQRYRLAARHAHARISDTLYQQATAEEHSGEAVPEKVNDDKVSDEKTVGEEEPQTPANVTVPAPSAEGQK